MYAAVRLLAEFGGVGGRGEVDQGLDGAIGHAGEHVGQILADGDREPAAALDDREDGGDFGASLLAPQVQPILASDGDRTHGIFGEVGAEFQHRVLQEPRELIRKRVVLAVCTGWMGSEMMASCRKQRMLVGCR